MMATSSDRTALRRGGDAMSGAPHANRHLVRIATMANFIGTRADEAPAFLPSTAAATGAIRPPHAADDIDRGAGNDAAAIRIAVICAFAATGTLSTNIL